ARHGNTSRLVVFRPTIDYDREYVYTERRPPPNGLHWTASEFVVEGDYFEDQCDVFIGWHVRNGKMGDVDLKGLDAALVISSPSRARRIRHLPAAAAHGLPGMTT